MADIQDLILKVFRLRPVTDEEVKEFAGSDQTLRLIRTGNDGDKLESVPVHLIKEDELLRPSLQVRPIAGARYTELVDKKDLYVKVKKQG